MSDLTIRKLKKKFNDEIKEYVGREIGSGTQIFVRDVLKSPEIFNLKEGKLSTKDINRKNEFIHEKAKSGKSIDYVIYIDSDIIIPLEVERLQNIEKGREQILDYQKVLDKKYGILTDGYIWRFYNNNIYREFNWEDITENTKEFLTFWQEYIKPEYYYLQYFEDNGQSKLIKDEGAFIVEKNRTLFFNDITKLIEGFKNKLAIEKYFEGLDQKEKAKKAIEITYAYIIQFILYKTLVDNQFDEFKKEFEDRQDAIYDALKTKQYKSILNIISGISNKISKNVYRPFSHEQEFINNTLFELMDNPRNELHDVSPWLDIFVFIKKYNFQNIENEIFGYIYENYLKELFEETKQGQYFTHPAVVNFMLEQIGYTKEEIKKRRDNDTTGEHISIVDPSCGSGTFLYSAVDRIIDSFDGDTEKISKQIEDLVINNVFGLDIAEFPLYLAEMNIIMRMLPLIINEKYNNPIDKKIKVFWTKDSIAEFINVKFNNPDQGKRHNATGMIQKSIFSQIVEPDVKSYVRDGDDLKEMKLSMSEIPRRRFDYVIGNPPYISYNKCSKQKFLIFELIKSGKIHLNDIYGINLHSIPNRRKKYSPKPNLYIFFIALGIALLKNNGKLCYIIPQTVLVNNDFDVIRYHLSKYLTIEKIITFSGKMFIGRGIKQNKEVPTSSLIFVINQKRPSQSNLVEVISYLDLNDNIENCFKNIKQNKKIIKNKILQKKLIENVSNWNFINSSKEFLNFYEEYKKNSKDLSIYYNHELALKEFNDKFLFDGSTNIPKKDVIDIQNINDKNNYYSIPELKSKSYKARVGGYYPKNTKIKIAEGSQGLVIAEPKYKILWKYINFDKFYFLEGESILPIYQQYCISSNNKEEVFYLFSLLSSRVVNIILEVFQKVKNEDRLSFLLGLTPLKDLFRVPDIGENNQFIKDEIIKMTEKMLNLEDFTLRDYVDFSKVLQQKFDDIDVKTGNLILKSEDKELKLKIKNNKKTVEQAIKDKYFNDKLELEDKKISLTELKSLPVIDFDKQKEIKDYIDDLVFALYFNVPVKKVGLNKAKEIKGLCNKNKFYKVVKGK
jgi:hypothetical protein